MYNVLTLLEEASVLSLDYIEQDWIRTDIYEHVTLLTNIHKYALWQFSGFDLVLSCHGCDLVLSSPRELSSCKPQGMAKKRQTKQNIMCLNLSVA